MGDHDDWQRRAGFIARIQPGQCRCRSPLNDTLQRYSVLSHVSRDGCKCTRPVEYLEPDIIAALMGAHPRTFIRFQILRAPRKGRTDPSLGNIENIANDRRCSGTTARARPDQQYVANKIAIEGHAIGDAVHFSNRRIFWHHGRMDALFDPSFRLQCNAKQLDPVSKIVSGLDIGQRD